MDNINAEKNLALEPEKGEIEIDLIELLYRLLEKIKWLILFAIVGALLSGVYTFRFTTPMYQATSKLFILNSKDSVLNLSDLQIGSQLANDYIEVFSNWHVHELVLQRLGRTDMTYTQLQKMVSVKNPASTRIIYITVNSSDPQKAMDIANTYADVAREFIAARMGIEMPTIFEEARIPDRPYSPNKTRNILIGFLLGGILAAAVVVIQFIADDRIYTGDMIEKRLGLATLGMMPEEGTSGGDKKSSGKRRGGKGKKA